MQVKTFLGLVTITDVWDWMEFMFIPSFYIDNWENGKVRP
jgi:hypothetical protein